MLKILRIYASKYYIVLEDNTIILEEIPMNSVFQYAPENSSAKPMELAPVNGKKVFANFDGGQISSNAGTLLLKETEQQVNIIEAVKSALNDQRDQRDQRYVIHSLSEQLQQRTYQIACGYEDANDSDILRDDPILKMCASNTPESDEALSSQPTISRLENAFLCASASCGEIPKKSHQRHPRLQDHPHILITVHLDEDRFVQFDQAAMLAFLQRRD